MIDLLMTLGEDGETDLVFSENDLNTESGLKTAVLVSLFTDARVSESELPPGESDLRGYWGDAFPEVAGDRYGSKLWLLAREKMTAEVRARAEEYAIEALQWLIDDGVASAIDVSVEVTGIESVTMKVQITRPKDATANFSFVWGN